MSRFHYLQAEGSLHRPERTGKGNPTGKTFDNLLDGQYYQDTLTGSVYRFFMEDGETNTANGTWELLIGYDRETGSLTNFGVTLASNKIGETTSVIGHSDANPIGTITSVPAYTYVQIRAGEDIRITDIEDSSKSISLTVSQDTNAGEVSVPVQEETTVFSFGVGSIISLEASIFSAYTSADPTKIQQGVERRDLADSIGTLSSNILDSATGVTSIGLKEIDPPVLLEDNEKLVIKNQGGDFDIVVVNGDQTLSSTTGSITVDSFNPTADYIIDRSFVYEPSYYAGSRITQTANGVEIVANAVDGANSAIASLNVYVNNTFATTSQLSQFNTDLSNAIAGVNTYSSATYATASQFSAFQTETSNAFASVNTFANALAAEAVLKVDANGNVASIALGADSGGSSININADQIQINNIEFNKDAGTIGSSNYVANNSGWIITGNGDAEFNQIFVRNGTISGGSIQDGATLSNLTISGNLNMGSGGAISGSDYTINSGGIFISETVYDARFSETALVFEGFDLPPSSRTYLSAFGYGGFTVSSNDQSLISGGYSLTGPTFIVNDNSGNRRFEINTASATDITSVYEDFSVDTDTLFVDASVDRVGINDSTPSYSLDVNGTFQVTGLSYHGDTINQTFGTTNKAILLSKDSNNDGIQMGIGGSGDFYMAPIDNNSANFSREFRWQPADDRWQVDDDLHVGGDITYVGTITDVSDSLLKENVVPLGSTIDKVTQLEAKVYDLIGEDTTREIGLFAQDVEPLFPELVSERQMTDHEGNTTTYKSLSYIQMVPVLLEAIKDLKQEVEELKQQLNNS